MESTPNLDSLRSAVELACQPSYVPRIEAGRQLVLDMPHDWVVENIEQVALDALELSDDWEYRRLLELANLLDAALVRRLAALGLNSSDSEIREAAEDFSTPPHD